MNISELGSVSYFENSDESLKTLNNLDASLQNNEFSFEYKLNEISVEPITPEPIIFDGWSLDKKELTPTKISFNYSDDYYAKIKEIRDQSIEELGNRGFTREKDTNVWITKALINQ